MGIPIQYLNGLGDTLLKFGDEFNGLGQGLGCASGDGLFKDFSRRQKMHLINTRNAIAKNPACVSSVFQPKKLLGYYDELIGAWDNEHERENTLERLSGIEEEVLIEELQGLGSLIMGTDDYTYEEAEEILDVLDGLGLFKKARAKVRSAITNVATRVAPKATAKVQNAITKVKNTGVFTKIKNAQTKVKEAAKKVGNVALKVAKGVVKATIKFNPVVTTARLGFLAAMKTNFGKMASRAYWGYFSEAEANAKGVSSAYWKDAKLAIGKLENMFSSKMQGNAENLKKAIFTGRGAKKAGELAAQGELGTLGELISAATITSAMAFITPLLAQLKQIFAKHKGDPEEGEGTEAEPGNERYAEEEYELDEEGQIVFDEAGNPVKKKGFFASIPLPVKIIGGVSVLVITGGIIYAATRRRTPKIANANPANVLNGTKRIKKAKIKKTGAPLKKMVKAIKIS
ncbi:MAG: hypothetical protein M3Q58_03420 [Bacteroidota bacterium]|nr:hypothetical protein [Bacteroidota bacterium]